MSRLDASCSLEYFRDNGNTQINNIRPHFGVKCSDLTEIAQLSRRVVAYTMFSMDQKRRANTQKAQHCIESTA